MSANGEKYMLYHYNPSTAAACVFVVLFAVSAIVHTFQLVWKRTWYFIPFVIGGICKFTLSQIFTASFHTI